LFDVAFEEKLRREWHVDFPHELEDWRIGLILGHSGSGKTTIAREVFGAEAYCSGYKWPEDQSILEAFPEVVTTQAICLALSSVGFSSPPSWALPFHLLSNGEQFRVTLARALIEHSDLLVFDEFTSVVDRTVAKCASAAVAKHIRREKQQRHFVAVSCHFDITEWLSPDWIFNVDENHFARSRLQRPKIHLDIKQVHSSAWELFKRHHYLTAKIHPGAQCFVAFWDNKPIAITAMLHAVGKRGLKREHRIAVLPDYQGVGIGNALSEHVCQHYCDLGFRVCSTTSHPAIIGHRVRSAKWRMTKKPRLVSAGKTTERGIPSALASHATNRKVASFAYISQTPAKEAT